MSLLELFCEVDDFCQVFEQVYAPQQLAYSKKRGPKMRLSFTKEEMSERFTAEIRSTFLNHTYYAINCS